MISSVGVVCALSMFAALAAGAAVAAPVPAREFTVEPGGLTLRAALDKVRAARTAGAKGPLTVRVKGRVYTGGTVTLGVADSGTASAPLRIVGETGAELSGGVPVTGWRVLADGTWEAPVPKGADGKDAYFEQLWVNGRRASRSCIPAKGRFRLGTTEYTMVTNGPNVYCREASAVTNAEIRAVLAATPADELPYVQMSLVNGFYDVRRVVRGYDAEKGILETRRHVWHVAWNFWDHTQDTVFENVRAGFRNPGDWFFDVKAGRIRYRPLPGETPDRMDAVGAVSGNGRILVLNGESDTDKKIRHVTFENVAFVHSGIPTMQPIYCYPNLKSDPACVGIPPHTTQTYSHQAADGYDGTVYCRGVEHVTFRNCRFAHTGNYGLDLEEGCRYVTVTDSTFEDLGAGGVRMGSVNDRRGARRAWYFPHKPWSTAHNVVTNCTIRHAGKTHAEGVGVAIFNCSDSKVIHCDIHDILYSGVSVGFSWGYGGSVAQRNEVGYNHIWNLGANLMSDLAGVYTLSTSYGTWVHDNVIHDVDCLVYGGWGLYCDEGSEGILMERNVVWNTEDGGFFLHYGSGLVIRDNVFAWNAKKGTILASPGVVRQVPRTLEFVRNVVVSRGCTLAHGGEPPKKPSSTDRWQRLASGVWAGNVWWNYAGPAKFGSNMDWAAWQEYGRDILSVNADPLFVNPDANDFRLRPDSPARALGISSLDPSLAGRRRK